jgi:hypothetical protein
MNRLNVQSTARLASLKELREHVLPNYLLRIPSDETLRAWFDAAKIPRFKANPTCLRGGGYVHYQVSAIERYFERRTAPKRPALRQTVAA